MRVPRSRSMSRTLAISTLWTVASIPAAGSAPRHCLAVAVEDLQEPLDVGLGVLDRQRPLLFLAGRLVDAAVHEPPPVGLEQRVVHGLEVPVPLERSIAERDRPLAAEVRRDGLDAGGVERLLAPLREHRP